MSTALFIFLLILIAAPMLLFAVIVYVAGPILVHRKPAIPYRPAWQTTAYEELTPEVRQSIRAAVQRFAAAGFEVVLNLQSEEPRLKTSYLHLQFINRQSGDTASLNAARGASWRTVVISISSEFSDGTRIGTDCNPYPGILPGDPLEDGLTISWARDPAVLWEMHRRRLDKARKAGLPRVAPSAGTEMQEFLERQNREYTRLARSRYMWIDEPDGLMWYTWKGAILGVWKMAPPIRQWRRRRLDHHAKREWLRLGMDDWRPPPSEGQVDIPAAPELDDPAPQAGQLGYEARLEDGEIRITETPGRTIAHIGMPTRRQILGRRWLRISWLVLLAVMLVSLWTFWFRAMGMRPSALAEYPWLLVILSFLLLSDGARLLLELQRARGMLVLVATPAGLSVQNPASGQPPLLIQRDDIELFFVRLLSMKWRKSTYCLHVQSHRGTKHLLGSAADRPRMDELRTSLARGMGIEAAERTAP